MMLTKNVPNSYSYMVESCLYSIYCEYSLNKIQSLVLCQMTKPKHRNAIKKAFSPVREYRKPYQLNVWYEHQGSYVHIYECFERRWRH